MKVPTESDLLQLVQTGLDPFRPVKHSHSATATEWNGLDGDVPASVNISA
jgi:hypothetical protein